MKSMLRSPYFRSVFNDNLRMDYGFSSVWSSGTAYSFTLIFPPVL